MDAMTRSDLFFMITAIAVVVVGFVATVLLIYVFMIVREVRAMLQMLKSGAETISTHYSEIEGKVKAGGIAGIAAAIAGAIISAFTMRKGSHKK